MKQQNKGLKKKEIEEKYKIKLGKKKRELHTKNLMQELLQKDI